MLDSRGELFHHLIILSASLYRIVISNTLFNLIYNSIKCHLEAAEYSRMLIIVIFQSPNIASLIAGRQIALGRAEGGDYVPFQGVSYLLGPTQRAPVCDASLKISAGLIRILLGGY